nr:MAG TPA: hypothetical protein [Caudoviricetes sp.]
MYQFGNINIKNKGAPVPVSKRYQIAQSRCVNYRCMVCSTYIIHDCCQMSIFNSETFIYYFVPVWLYSSLLRSDNSALFLFVFVAKRQQIWYTEVDT